MLQKNSQIYQKLRKLAKLKPFGEIFWNLVFAGLKSGWKQRKFGTTGDQFGYACFFWISAYFGRFFTKKTAKIGQKLRKLAKSKPFGEVF